MLKEADGPEVRWNRPARPVTCGTDYCYYRVLSRAKAVVVDARPLTWSGFPCYCSAMAQTRIKPSLVLSILCDDVRQELGGKFSLMGLFEAISAGTFPAVHPRFAVMNEWTGGRGEFVAAIRLLAPDRKKVLAESDATFTLFNEGQRHRDISVRFNTTFPVPGTYWLEMLLDGEQVGLVPLPVQQVNQQTVH